MNVPSPREHRPSTGLLTVACLVAVADSLLITALPPLIPHYQHGLGIGSTLTGILVGGYSIGLLVGSLPAGYLTARYGPRRIVVIGLASLAVSGALFGVASTFPTLLAARIVGGVSSAFSWTSILTWCIERSTPGRRDHVNGIVFGAGFAGVTLGPALGALAAEVGTRPVFIAFAIAAAALIAPLLMLPDAQVAVPANMGAFIRIARSPSVAVALSLQALPGFISGALGLLLTLRLAQLGTTATGIAAAFFVAALVQGAGSVLVGRWAAIVGARRPALVGVLAAGCLTACFAAIDDALLLSATLVVVYTATAVILVSGASLLSAAVAQAGQVSAFGYALMNLAFAPGAIVGSIASGAVRQGTGQALALIMVSVVCLCTAIPLFRRRPEGRRAAGASATARRPRGDESPVD